MLDLRRIRTIQDVVDWRMCIGCGACIHACSHGAISLKNFVSEGIRPVIDARTCERCGGEGCQEALAACPGYHVDGDLLTQRPKRSECDIEFGSTLEVWEGYAADPEIRGKGSSGALTTALSLYCLEREGMEFVMHTGARTDEPWLNQTVQSRTRAELLERAGSRYAPASPCDSLDLIEQSPRPCVFVGKPCDAAAVAKLRAMRPALREKVGVILTFFCAGTPSTQGTLNLLKSLEVEADEVETLRYRGEGWPGRFKVTKKEDQSERSLSYEDSWDRLNRYRPFRCHLCPDGLGRVADIACGDAWQSHKDDGDPGRSIILVRTAKGQAILRGAVEAGYVVVRPLEPREVLTAQKNLLARRREIFGRLLGMKLLGVPTPRLEGFSLLRSWLRQPPAMMLRTVLGTMRRVIQRGMRRRRAAPAGEPGALERASSMADAGRRGDE